MGTKYLTVFPKATEMRALVSKQNDKEASEKRMKIIEKLSPDNLTNSVQSAAKLGKETSAIVFDDCSLYEFEELMKDSVLLSFVVDDLLQLGYKVRMGEGRQGNAILFISWGGTL